MSTPIPASSRDDRRGFLKKFLATAISAVLGLAPVVAGVRVLLDPLRRRGSAGEFQRVTSLDWLPADGVPRKFTVIADRENAWNKFRQVPVGAVYLRRTVVGKVQALNVVCPHAGCFVDFVAARGKFHCPCHNSSFAVDGAIADPKSPASRGLDSLEVELRNEREVWVKFQNFEAGKAAKVAIS